MNHMGTVTIETKRLLLRRFTPNDIEPAFRNWMHDSKVTKFLQWSAHASMQVTEEVLLNWVDQYKKNNFYLWAIVLKEINEPIGSISVVDQKEAAASVQIGYCIGRKWWCQGITSEAFLGIIPFLLEQVKVNRIEARHDPNNPNSGKVMVKCGLQYEGTLRQADINNQGIVDTAMYSLLAEEYDRAK